MCFFNKILAKKQVMFKKKMIKEDKLQVEKKEFKKISIYSNNWRSKNIIGFKTRYVYDIMIDDKNFYLIKLDRVKGVSVKHFIGFATMGIIGVLLANLMVYGKSFDEIKYYRTAWVDFDGNIMSDIYKNHILLKIPMSKLGSSLKIKKKSIVIKYGDFKRSFEKDEEECSKIKKILKKYVLL